MAAFAAFKEEIKAGQDSVKEEMKAVQESVKDEMNSVQEKMEKSVKEEMKAVQESVKDEMNSVQEKMEKSVKDEMNSVQERTEKSVNEEMKAAQEKTEEGQEEMKREITSVIENKFEAMEGRIDAVENKVEQIEGRVSAVEQQIDDKISAVAKEVDTLKKFVATAGSKSDSFKFLPMSVRPSLKLSTYGKTSWQVYKTQFSIVAEANGWDSQAKACHLAASLRADAADILQTLPESKRLDFEALSGALELRFGEKCLKDYSRLQLKSRQQKPTETLQELATDVERLSHLAFSECPTETREILSLQYFIDGIRDPEIQKALRMADVKDLKSALVYAMKFEAAQQATRRDRHPIRAAHIQEPVDPMTARLDELTRKVDALTRNTVSGGNNGIFIMGQINGIPCNMTIDTGANVTIIRKDLAQQLEGKLIWTPPCVTLQTVSGEKIDIEGKLNVNITFGSATYHHTAYVAEITDPCILGLDFLRKHNFSLDFKNNELHSASEDITLFEINDEGVKSIHKIIAQDDITIPARTEILLPGSIAENRNFRYGVMEYPKKCNSPKGVLIASALVDLSGTVIPVRVANVTDKARVIKKGEVVAECTPVTSVERKSNISKPVSSDNIISELLQNAQLNDEEKNAAERVIKDLQDVFSRSSSDVGRTSLTQHRIDTGDHPPIKQHPRRLPIAKQEEVRALLKDMQESNVIEPSASPWASPIVLVRKKDGSTRFCVDYRRLNEVTKKDSYPLPRIDDILDTLSGSKWFSTLDLKSGYWQVEIHPDDREKTAFTTGQGLWQFKVMPFGLCNAPATFERLMETVLKGLSYEACLIYLDDIIIVGKSFEEHLENLRKVLQKLKEANLKLSPAKCKLFRQEVTYLGHVISAEGVRTDPEKVSAVKDWRRPENVHQLRSFLGLCTYYRRFVKDFSSIARPLHKLTESKQKFVWTKECENAFKNLKEALTSAPILTYPQLDRPFILDTDASNESVGAVLSQEIEGQERVVAYWSKCLSKPERNYCVTRKELLAIVKAVEHFHHYLYGRKFLLRTDHASLAWLLNFKNPEGQIARWIQRLQEYDITIRHRKGQSHGNADALSRRPCPENCRYCSRVEAKYQLVNPVARQITASTLADPDPWTDKEIRKDQLQDRDIKPIIELMETSNRKPTWQDISSYSPTTKQYWALWDSLHIRNGVLYRKFESDDGKTFRWQLVLPRSRIPDVLKELHSSPAGGHFGIMKTLQRVRERFYWNNAKDDVQKWCRTCDACVSRKGPKKRSRGKLQRYNVGAPFERIAFDILGPLPRTADGNKYILVAIDYFTKWPEAYPIPDQEAVTVAEMMIQHWISRFGVPLQLHSDQGRNFTSAVVKELCKLLGIDKTQTTPLHPQSDGMVERFNRTILNNLSLVVSRNQQDWDKKLPLFLLAYRSAVHETTGYSPSQMLFGRDLRLPCDLLFGRPPDAPSSPEEYIQDLQARFEVMHNFARERVNLATEKMKTRYDTRATGHRFNEGDKVWLWNPTRRKGLSPKLQSPWDGPYTVLNRLNDVVVRIRKSSNSKPKVVHYDRLQARKKKSLRSSETNEQREARLESIRLCTFQDLSYEATSNGFSEDDIKSTYVIKRSFVCEISEDFDSSQCTSRLTSLSVKDQKYWSLLPEVREHLYAVRIKDKFNPPYLCFIFYTRTSIALSKLPVLTQDSNYVCKINQKEQ
ncbi:Retrovirus-related Pol polyprotein from transposon 412, partial [Stegodyphus mimosarum]